MRSAILRKLHRVDAKGDIYKSERSRLHSLMVKAADCKYRAKEPSINSSMNVSLAKVLLFIRIPSPFSEFWRIVEPLCSSRTYVIANEKK